MTKDRQNNPFFLNLCLEADRFGNPMKSRSSPFDLLENHWATPAYGGWLLAVLSLCFFGAATNTMAGWLYVLSGLIFALLVIAAVIPGRSLRQIELERLAIAPVSAGDDLTLILQIKNQSKNPKILLQFWDILPDSLGKPQGTAIESIPAEGKYDWAYYLPTQQRGIYRWQTVQLRTGAPLGLFWCRRQKTVPAKAVVYPQVLPLLQCPLVDTIGQEESPKQPSDRRYIAATEGITKTLRPYRYGDSIRLIHWRSSARFDEFKVRELEVVTGGQEVIICLDSGAIWDSEIFEQAVIATASLYFYALRCQLNVKLWTAKNGIVQGTRTVLETLAAVENHEAVAQELPSKSPLIWLTQNENSLGNLPFHSRWLYFSSDENFQLKTSTTGLVIAQNQSLEKQLQRHLR